VLVIQELYIYVSAPLKGPSDQIRSSQEWYHWIGLNSDIPRHRFFIFYFAIEFLKRIQSFKALTDTIYLTSNGLRGRQALLLPEF
jgi:hypothetical protein